MIKFANLNLFISILAASTTLNFTNGQTNDENQSKSHGCVPGSGVMENRQNRQVQNLPSIVGRTTECVNGQAAQYPCSNIVLESFISNRDLNGGQGNPDLNDIWGWSKNGREFALIGLDRGTSFVEITNPTNPVVIGQLPTKTAVSIWRDIKTYNDHAFIVSEASGHGMQVFDLNRLLTASPYATFTEDAHYSRFGSAHNVFINEESGFAYAVGTNRCAGGLHMVDINDPLNPTKAGCFSARGYTHDVQCVIYDGPDTEHTGKEICFASNEDTVDIIDVTNKAMPTLLSFFEYDNDEYTHQGWLTEDQKYFLVDDELDEYYGTISNTRTVVFDVSDLNNPVIQSTYLSATGAIDHNQYVKGRYTYQANYRAGLRILDLDDIDNGFLTEVAYFDTYPANDNAQFNSAWSNYPYFDSGVVVISDIEQGLFVVRPDLLESPTRSPVPFPTMTPTQSPESLPTMLPTHISSVTPSNSPTITTSNSPSRLSNSPSRLSNSPSTDDLPEATSPFEEFLLALVNFLELLIAALTEVFF